MTTITPLKTTPDPATAQAPIYIMVDAGAKNFAKGALIKTVVDAMSAYNNAAGTVPHLSDRTYLYNEIPHHIESMPKPVRAALKEHGIPYGGSHLAPLFNIVSSTKPAHLIIVSDGVADDAGRAVAEGTDALSINPRLTANFIVIDKSYYDAAALRERDALRVAAALKQEFPKQVLSHEITANNDQELCLRIFNAYQSILLRRTGRPAIPPPLQLLQKN